VSSLLAGAAQAQPKDQWTSIYIGAHGGWAGSTIEFPLNPGPGGTPWQDLYGAMIGGQIGAQYQFHSNLVVGVEADVSFGNLNATVRDGNYITESGKIGALGTARLRLGYAIGPFMPFVTGGLAWDTLKQGEVCPDPAAVPFGFCRPAAGHAPFNLTQTKTETGTVWGGGVEYAIGYHWSLKAEALWADFGKTQFTLCCDVGGNPLPPSTTEHDVKTFRAGVNYRF